MRTRVDRCAELFAQPLRLSAHRLEPRVEPRQDRVRRNLGLVRRGEQRNLLVLAREIGYHEALIPQAAQHARPFNRKLVDAEAEVPKAMADSFRSGKLGILDYYKLRNVQADTNMRQAIAGTGMTAQTKS